MRTTFTSLALVAVAGLAFVVARGASAAGDPSILGKEAPAISTAEFLQSDGRTQIADFKGEVVFLEVFATW